MRIAVFGATGGLGRCIVEQALAEGHEIVGFARKPDGLPGTKSHLTFVAGNVLDPEAVQRAVAGCDGVISAFGVKPGAPVGHLYSDGARTLVTAMEAAGVRRLVSISTWLVGASRRRAGPLVRLFVPLLQPELFRDRERQEAVIRESLLDWILVRPSRLTDGRRVGRYRAGTDLKLRASAHISRADVAHFVLKQLRDDTYLRQATTVSY